MVINVLNNIVKFIVFAVIVMLGWALYLSVTYKVNPSILTYGYKLIERNEIIILDSVIQLVETKKERERLIEIDKTMSLTLNKCRIAPISNIIDRFLAREHYYISYYSGDNSNNDEVYAKVYVYDSGDFAVSEVGKEWHH